MAETELECPDAAEDLYLAATRDEVEASRPVLTGDVFEDVAIPARDNSYTPANPAGDSSPESLPANFRSARLPRCRGVGVDEERDPVRSGVPMPGVYGRIRPMAY